ncbi:MAG: PaaI family thioesterase [Actinobacteria bacterium]|nr:MAG: PaaI family thioesterase [Actinomycetota bacterium]
MDEAGAKTERVPVYAHCFVCGKQNPMGLAVSFRREGDEVITDFTPESQHQGYPGVCHGGIIYALLDETVGRATYRAGVMTVTGGMQIRYRKPVPIGSPVRIAGRLVADRGRLLEGEGEATLEDGTVVAEARGKFFPLPAEEQERVAGVLDWEETGDVP